MVLFVKDIDQWLSLLLNHRSPGSLFHIAKRLDRCLPARSRFYGEAVDRFDPTRRAGKFSLAFYAALSLFLQFGNQVDDIFKSLKKATEGDFAYTKIKLYRLFVFFLLLILIFFCCHDVLFPNVFFS